MWKVEQTICLRSIGSLLTCRHLFQKNNSAVSPYEGILQSAYIRLDYGALIVSVLSPEYLVLIPSGMSTLRVIATSWTWEQM